MASMGIHIFSQIKGNNNQIEIQFQLRKDQLLTIATMGIMVWTIISMVLVLLWTIIHLIKDSLNRLILCSLNFLQMDLWYLEILLLLLKKNNLLLLHIVFMFLHLLAENQVGTKWVKIVSKIHNPKNLVIKYPLGNRAL